MRPPILDSMRLITILELAERSPDWDLLAREILLVFLDGKNHYNRPEYLRAALLGYLKPWRVLHPDHHPASGVPRGWAYWVVDIRQFKPGSRPNLYLALPRFRRAMEEAMAQANVKERALEAPRTEPPEFFTKPDQRWSWFI